MKGLFYFVLVCGCSVFDQCMQANGSFDICNQVGVYAPQNYSNLLGSYGYPILRDKSCERGRCMAHFYKNECEVCDNEACHKKCLEKKSNTKELLEFLKEVIVSKYKNSSPSQYEIINTVTVERPSTVTVTEQPQKAVSPSGCVGGKCETTSRPSQTIEPVTVVKSEVRTVTVEPTMSRSEPGEGGRGQFPIKEPCTNPLASITECFGALQSIERQLKSSISPPFVGVARRRRLVCTPDESDCGSETKSKRSRKNRDSGSGSDEGDERASVSRTRPRRPGSQSTRKPGRQKAITLTRTVDKTVTVSEPITLFREYTTTVVNEKPIINYKISTITSTEYKTVTKSSKEGEGANESSGVPAESTKPEKGVSKTVDIPCKGPSCNESLDSLLKKCEQLKGCREMLLDTKTPQASVAKPAPDEPAVKKTEPKAPDAVTKTVTKAPTSSVSASVSDEPKVIYRTETVRTTVTVTSASEPAKAQSSATKEAATTTENQPEVVVTKTVSVPIYKTLREEADTETVYRTVTKKVKRPQAKTASKLCDEPERKHRSLALRCKFNMTDCRSSGDQEGPQPADKPKGGRRTIINTIYSIQKSQNGDEGGNDSVTKTVYIN